MFAGTGRTKLPLEERFPLEILPCVLTSSPTVGIGMRMPQSTPLVRHARSGSILLAAASIVVLSILLVLSGCVTGTIYDGVQIEGPAPEFERRWQFNSGTPIVVTPAEVNSLTPLLRWRAAAETGTTYDVSIYSAVERIHWTVTQGNEWRAEPGEEVYYRENLSGTEHLVEDPLKPGALYVWSVRTRHDDRVGKWTTFAYSWAGAGAWGVDGRGFIPFKTPNSP